jgi:hypothetical protein
MINYCVYTLLNKSHCLRWGTSTSNGETHGQSASILKSVPWYCRLKSRVWKSGSCRLHGITPQIILPFLATVVRLNSVNACYHSVQNLLSSRLLSKNIKIRIYKTITLPVVLYGCKTWSLTLREERRLRDEVTGEWRKLHNEELHNLSEILSFRTISIVLVLKNKPREIAERWIESENSIFLKVIHHRQNPIVTIHNLCSSLNIIRMIKSRRMRLAGHVARMRETRNAYRILVGKPEGKRPLGGPRRGWLGNIKRDRMGLYGLDRSGSG